MFIPPEEKKIFEPAGNATSQIRAALEEKTRAAAADAALRAWDSTKVAADNFAVAIKKVHLNKNEMIESVELLASTN